MTSSASYIVWPNAAGYIAARQALKGFADALRVEVVATGVVVSLIVLGTVESSYWQHNPGSRQRVPRGSRPLTTDEAAATIIRAISGNKRLVVRPAWFRLLFAVVTVYPGFASRR